MSYSAVLCHIVLCCVILCCAVSYCAVLCRIALCCVVLCCAVSYCAVLCYVTAHLLSSDNVLCEGPNFIEQAEECHYRDHDTCFPTAMQILERVNISASPSGTGRVEELCKCGFRQGKRVCINCE